VGYYKKAAGGCFFHWDLGHHLGCDNEAVALSSSTPLNKQPVGLLLLARSPRQHEGIEATARGTWGTKWGRDSEEQKEYYESSENQGSKHHQNRSNRTLVSSSSLPGGGATQFTGQRAPTDDATPNDAASESSATPQIPSTARKKKRKARQRHGVQNS
jgi:hypothetical protein